MLKIKNMFDDMMNHYDMTLLSRIIRIVYILIIYLLPLIIGIIFRFFFDDSPSYSQDISIFTYIWYILFTCFIMWIVVVGSIINCFMILFVLYCIPKVIMFIITSKTSIYFLDFAVEWFINMLSSLIHKSTYILVGIFFVLPFCEFKAKSKAKTNARKWLKYKLTPAHVKAKNLLTNKKL